jgi:hypothetical protein
MKQLFVFIFLMPALAQSQDTCKLIRQTDPFTKLNTISTGFIQLQGGSLVVDASKPEIDLLFSVSGLNKCFTDDATAAIFFVGSKVKNTERNDGSMNCEGLFHVTFRNQATPVALLRKLATTKIEKILFTGNDKTETTITLTPEQQLTVMALMGCILKESPALLQAQDRI